MLISKGIIVLLKELKIVSIKLKSISIIPIEESFCNKVKDITKALYLLVLSIFFIYLRVKTRVKIP